MTLAEKKLWYEYLKNHKCKFLRQKPIGNYIIDFYCQKIKLAIEIDGETHLTESEKNYGKRRTSDFSGYGIKVIRFWNNEIFNRIEAVIEKIENEINKIKN